MSTSTRVRAVATWVNFTTPLGLAVARLGGTQARNADDDTYLATNYRLPFPMASAFTVGAVVVTRHDDAWLRERPELLEHERRHVSQYAVLGQLFLPAYVAATAVSYAVSGDRAAFNPFERAAGLAEGGYRPRPPWWRRLR